MTQPRTLTEADLFERVGRLTILNDLLQQENDALRAQLAESADPPEHEER